MMEVMDMVQVRTPKAVKTSANEILDALGLNMSTYVNMALKQLIIQQGIPFETKVKRTYYTPEEKIREVAATMAMEGMPLTEEDFRMLRDIDAGLMTYDEAIQKVLSEV